jgi:PhzF family phenazine biosynthesis protein
MRLPFFQVDAFTGTAFRGNPAGVVIMKEWLSEETMQAIAFENNLSETAFIHPRGNAPGAGVPEDPVTGSTHCALVS